MSHRASIVHQISGRATIAILVVVGLAALVGWQVASSAQGGIVGGLAFLVNSYGSRLLIGRQHRRGIALIHRGCYAEAIERFEASYDFFSRHQWLDRYRSVLMMSVSAISYREMALLNIAGAHRQAGDGCTAKEYYERTLAEFPGSVLAQSTLRFIESVEQAT